MRLPAFSLIITFLFCVQCESIFLNENSLPEISAVIEGEDLVIKNNLHFDIYYFAVDQETSYLIDWAPIETEENRIRAKRARVFSTDDILSYDPEKTVVVFIWGNNRNYWNGVEILP